MSLVREQAIETIHTMHVLIEKVSSGTHRPEDFPILFAYFADHFEMIGAAGKHLNLTEVKSLFLDHQGDTPDIKISIHDEEVLLQTDNTIVITYTEKHQFDDRQTSRRSCVLMEEIDGKILWTYLQETFLS